MTKGSGLPEYHEAFLNDLTAAFDIEAGLRDAIHHLDHADLVTDLGGALNIEKGLASALDELDDEDSTATMPETPPIVGGSIATQERPESAWFTPRGDRHDPESDLDRAVTEAFSDLIRLLRRLRANRAVSRSLNIDIEFKHEESQVLQLHTLLVERSISREDALQIIDELRRRGFIRHRGQIGNPQDRQTLDRMLHHCAGPSNDYSTPQTSSAIPPRSCRPGVTHRPATGVGPNSIHGSGRGLEVPAQQAGRPNAGRSGFGVDSSSLWTWTRLPCPTCELTAALHVQALRVRLSESPDDSCGSHQPITCWLSRYSCGQALASGWQLRSAAPPYPHHSQKYERPTSVLTGRSVYGL